jgi:HAD superfamily hydrolase (TIGR01509 family)
MDKKYAIFDMDGTLIDSMAFWRNLPREYLKIQKVDTDISKLADEIAPLTVSEAAALFVERFQLKSEAERVASEMNNIMAEHYRKDIPLKNKANTLIDGLVADGVRLCVASATDKELVAACLGRLGIIDRFEFILSCEELGTSKRKPLIFLEAAERFKAMPAEVAVYEDALYAVQTAKKAGFYTIGVYDSESEKAWRIICAMADETVNMD